MNQKFEDICSEHGGKLVFGSAIALSFLFNGSFIQENSKAINIARSVISSNNMSQSLLEEQRKVEIAQSKIAKSRYRDGCILVVAASNTTRLATIVEGETVTDRTTKKPLPVGSVVCDSFGNTGVLKLNNEKLPVVASIAYTGDKRLIDDAIQKIRGHRLYIYTPEKE